ncbi:MAG TPA: SDR family oxidoreductase [Anaerolineae bacterium]|nr:SDR family oxidoreductase [Anaerolineae bacterium]
MLHDHVIIVTGASQGIGRSIAEACASERARVVLAARCAGALSAIADAIRAGGGDVLAVPTDVTDEAQVEHLVAQALDHYGRVNGLVNSAGVSPLSPITETSLEVWEHTLAVNATGTFLCCRAVWAPMIEAGGGSILNISSGAGKRAHAGWVAYCASKWAVMGLTESLALEGFPVGIRVNALCPGPTATPMREANFPNEDKSRLLDPEEVAEAALFFLSGAAQHVRNAALDVRKQPRGWGG